MFSFDKIDLPRVERRVAFVGIDFQDDFTNENGSLPVIEPEGYLTRAAQLAKVFRDKNIDIIWTQTIPERTVPLDEEEIFASDTAPSRGTPMRRRPMLKALSGSEAHVLDPEAFLSQSERSCLRASSSGCELSKDVVGTGPKRDIILTKAGYSAFRGTQLLRTLRSKMVMELYICGSLANIGVYATALDAAQHGIAVTLVEDCCGYRSIRRKELAFHSLVDLVGCDILSAGEVRDVLQPAAKGSKRANAVSEKAARRTPGRSETKNNTDALISQMSDLDLGFEKTVGDEGGAADGAESKRASSKAAESSSLGPKDASDTANASSEQIKSALSAESEITQDISVQLPRLGPFDQDTQPNSTEEADADDTIAKLSEAFAEQPNQLGDLIAEFRDVKMDDRQQHAPSAEMKPSQRGLCSRDTDIIEDLLPGDLATEAFDKLKDELDWQRMSHQGGEVPRLVAVQGDIDEDGNMPVYRHPSDESPPLLSFTPTVLAIKAEVEKHLGHPLNHALIQFYRGGTDYISEHSDKTIDVVHGSFIANVSLGAQRTMVLRQKRAKKADTEAEKASGQNAAATVEKAAPSLDTEATVNARKTQRVTLRHNSLCRMGLKTNKEWMHSIRQDKRAPRDKNADELAFGGARISLTFRHIGTFLNKDQTLIWGQGATGKTREEAHGVINGQGEQAVDLLKAFGTENHSPQFDWDAHYGKGSDVLHMSAALRFFSGRDETVNMRIKLMLAEFGLGYAKGSLTLAGDGGFEAEEAGLKFVDNDEARTVVDGDLAIMLYLDARSNPTKKEKGLRSDDALVFIRFQKGMALLRRLRRYSAEDPMPGWVRDELRLWNSYLIDSADKWSGKKGDGLFVAGTNKPTLADFAFWPVLYEICQKNGSVLGEGKLEALATYNAMMTGRDAVKKILGVGKEGK